MCACFWRLSPSSSIKRSTLNSLMIRQTTLAWIIFNRWATLFPALIGKRDLGQYPTTLQESLNYQNLLYGIDESDESFDRIEDHFFSYDPFSRRDELIQYVPLYDRQSRQRKSYLLLSAGLDGKFNNTISLNDTLYMDSWWASAPVYNFEQAIFAKFWRSNYNKTRKYIEDEPVEYIERFSVYWKKCESPLNPFHYFGNKDCVILMGPVCTDL